MRAIWKRVGASALVALLAMGCSSLGPKTIPRDHFDYVEAIRDSWKEQMLINMVGLRYAEAPLFLRVTSVINQYSIDGRINAAAPPYSGVGSSPPPLGLSGGYADRPTVTYTPMTGADFTRSVMTPIPPQTIMSMIQAGWSAEKIMRLAVRAINGVSPNPVAGNDVQQTAYFEVVLLMQKLQKSGGLSFRIERRGPTDVAVVIVGRADSKAEQLNRTRLAELLGLDPGLPEYRLVYGHQASGSNEIAMLTRSILEMLMELSMWIYVPAQHVDMGSTVASPVPDAETELGFSPLINVYSSTDKPEEAFAMVEYDSLWYWVDKNDYPSKTTMTFMQLMFSLAESGSAQQAPLVTVQAGG